MDFFQSITYFVVFCPYWEFSEKCAHGSATLPCGKSARAHFFARALLRTFSVRCCNFSLVSPAFFRFCYVITKSYSFRKNFNASYHEYHEHILIISYGIFLQICLSDELGLLESFKRPIVNLFTRIVHND